MSLRPALISIGDCSRIGAVYAVERSLLLGLLRLYDCCLWMMVFQVSRHVYEAGTFKAKRRTSEQDTVNVNEANVA
jgi:hypothetical protein